jgi:glycosyltransferase involved in cell wall biosynthesis
MLQRCVTEVHRVSVNSRLSTVIEAAEVETTEHITRHAVRQGPLRILLVTPQYLPHAGGAEIHTYEVARRMVAAGHEVTVLTTDVDGDLPADEVMAGVSVHRVPAWPSRSDYFFAPGIHRFITRGNWDIVHCQGYHTLVAPITMLAAWQAKCPYIVTFHSGGHSSWLRNMLRPLQRMLLRPLLNRAVGLVAVSKWEADFFRQSLRIPAERFCVIPNGAYLPECSTPPPTEGDATLIVSVGRLERYKGHHRVIASLPLLIEKYPRVRLRIVGSGPYEASLRQLAEDLEVADRVEIRPVSAKDREGMASVLLGAALVILLSDYEAQGISVLEALALGRPVLVADTTALRELATSGLARATPLGGTAEEVAEAILNQLNQPLIPTNAQLPTWDACASDLLSIYHRALRARSVCAF